MSEKNIIKAIYETKREQILLAWLTDEGEAHMSPAYVFAYDVRMWTDADQDSFEGAYITDKNTVEAVLKYLDECWIKESNGNGKVPTFYELETHFRFSNCDRENLLHIVRWAKLSDKFDDKFYQTLASNAPMEANNVHLFTYNQSDIYIP